MLDCLVTKYPRSGGEILLQDTNQWKQLTSILMRNLALKQDALKKASPVNATAGKLKPDGQLLSFLRNLQPDGALL